MRNRGLTFFRNTPIPATMTILVAAGLTFILSIVLSAVARININYLLTLTTQDLFKQSWKTLIYPLANYDFINLVLAGVWLWFIGGSLEITWGSAKYSCFLLVNTIITGLAMTMVSRYLLNNNFALFGLWLPLLGLTWAWALEYPGRELLFWGVIPLKAIWLAWIDLGITFFNYLPIHWLLGLSSLTGLGVVFFFHNRSFKGPKPGGQRQKRVYKEKHRHLKLLK